MTNLSAQMKIHSRYLLVLLLTAFLCTVAIGQQLTVNTKKIDKLIDQWNILHNSQNLEAFENVYDDQLLFYTERVPRTKATLMKKLLFVRNPGYKQRISTDIKYTLHTNGVVKCEFTKEVWKNSGWDSSPMYLLVGFKNHGYWVIGESDFETDKKFKYSPRIGEALDLEILSTSMNSEHSLIAPEVTTKANFSGPATTLKEFVSFRGFPFYLVILVLGAGAALLVLRERIYFKNQNKKLEEESVEMLPEEDYDIVPEQPKLGHEAYQVIENHLKQHAFQEYALRLFDPFSFSPEKLKENALVAYHERKDFKPDYVFDLKNSSGYQARFSVQFVYAEDTGASIELFPPEQIDSFQKFASANELYFVIGIGGPPDWPTELYVISPSEINSAVISKNELKPYRRRGNFSYDSATKRLQ